MKYLICIYFNDTSPALQFIVFLITSIQIIPPHDKGIESAILNNLCPWETSWDTSILTSSTNVSDPLQEAQECYMKTLGQDELQQKLNQDCNINFTYTAMHGVGYLYMEEAFRTAKFKVQTPHIKSFPAIPPVTPSSAAYMLLLYVRGVTSLTDMHQGNILSRFFIFVLIILT
jgi:phosphomannomutase